MRIRSRTITFLRFMLLFMQPLKIDEFTRDRFRIIVTIVRAIRLSFLLVFLSVLIGVMGFRYLEGYSWLDAVYMAVITISTVGFGEVRPLSEEGRIFTSALILFNVGTYAYAISSVVRLFAEGSFLNILNEYQMHRDIEALSGHTIICGYGRHATEVAQELDRLDIPFVIIDNSPEKIEWLKTETGYLYINGDATHDEVIREAGIGRASSIVVTLPNDSDSLYVVLSARELNPGIRIIARANNHADELKMRRAGADETVVPEKIGGFFMATMVHRPDLMEFFKLLSNMGASNVMFEEIPVNKLKSRFANKTIGESGVTQIAPVSLLAIKEPNGTYKLNPDKVMLLKPGLDLVIMGEPDQVIEFKQKALEH